MSDLTDLERRLAALEQRMDEEAGLRASQDRDLGTLSAAYAAQTHLMQALAITQSEHTEQIRRLREDITTRLDRHEVVLSQLRTGMGDLVGMLTTLIEGNGQ